MRGRLFATVATFVLVVACGGSSATIGASDGGGLAADGATTDDAASSLDGASGDGATGADAGPVTDAHDEASACEACKPDFCGCGQCTEAQVVCTKTPKACPLQCATACDLTQYKCACDADRCVRTSPAPGAVVPCYTTLDCPPGNCCMQRSGPLQGACIPGNGC